MQVWQVGQVQSELWSHIDSYTDVVMNSQPVNSDNKVSSLSFSFQRITKPFQQKKTNTKPDLSQWKSHILAKGHKIVVSIYTFWKEKK